MTKRIWFVLISVLLLFIPGFAQQTFLLSGNVVSSESSHPLPFAWIYIQEQGQSVMCDEQGDFGTHLPYGTYHLTIHAGDYRSAEREVVLDENRELRIELSSIAQELGKLSRDERKRRQNKAIRIMEQVMLLSPIMERALESYQATAYTKESYSASSLPYLLSSFSMVGYRVKDYLGKSYSKEWVLDVDYTHPDKYTQVVKAFRSTVPQEIEKTRAQSNPNYSTNIYEPLEINRNDINPLRPEGMEQYEYILLDSVCINGTTIHHISYRQRAGLGSLAHGHIYVESGHWNVLSLTKITGILGNRVQQIIQIQQAPVYANLYMPTLRTYSLHSNLLGVRANYYRYNTFRYHSIKPNSGIAAILRNPDTLRVPHERLNLYRAAQIIEHKISNQVVHQKDPYLVSRNFHQETITRIDSVALERTEEYWDKMNGIPLTPVERYAMHRNDSLGNLRAQKQDLQFEKYSRWKDFWKKLLWGDRFNAIEGNDAWKFRYKGILSLFKDYNYWDGLVLGSDAYLIFYPSYGTQWYLVPSISYSLKKKRPIWSLETGFLFAPQKRGYANITFGQGTPDRAGDRSDSFRYLNSLSTLLNGKGSAILMEEQYFSGQLSVDVARGLRATMETGISKHRSLPPEYVWGIIHKRNKMYDWDSHLYSAEKPDEGILHSAYTIGGTLELNPTPYYTLNRQGRKFYDAPGARSPMFYLGYKSAIPRNRALDSHYTRADFKMVQQINLSALTKINYSIEIGSYFVKKRIYPEDRIFLSTGNNFITTEDRWEQFFSMPSYTTAADNYAIARVSFKSPGILFNYLLPASIKRGQEQIILKTYWDVMATPYFELGYIKNFGPFSFGLFYGGHNFYDHVGFNARLILNI